MVGYQKTLSFFTSILFLTSILAFAVSPVMAAELPIWEAQIPGSGEEVVSLILEQGKEYRIVAEEIWWYDFPNNLAADAQFYTTDPSDHWNWGNHFPAPDGHSFLQIDEEDVDWGTFSNGDTRHTYTIHYTGEGAAITFRIVDWMDHDYSNNECHIVVKIYEHKVSVGGYGIVTAPTEEVWVNQLMNHPRIQDFIETDYTTASATKSEASSTMLLVPEILYGASAAATTCLIVLILKTRKIKSH